MTRDEMLQRLRELKAEKNQKRDTMVNLETTIIRIDRQIRELRNKIYRKLEHG